MHVDVLFICQDPREILGMRSVTVRRGHTSVCPHLANPPLQDPYCMGGTLGTPAIYIPSVVLNDSEVEG